MLNRTTFVPSVSSLSFAVQSAAGISQYRERSLICISVFGRSTRGYSCAVWTADSIGRPRYWGLVLRTNYRGICYGAASWTLPVDVLGQVACLLRRIGDNSPRPDQPSAGPLFQLLHLPIYLSMSRLFQSGLVPLGVKFCSRSDIRALRSHGISL
ncbi:hypothetical protein OBBRIDRAFT_226677 [Obba rivulosa]|uniref:Uncharacterized protein n=1 Tax=Obba rivulosa TaxID=1052685 RepID=A0A8E2AKU0_9APHY|nr:hypothetical protein OBBRIDRAFT_226677 [Obba rivulosa]